MSLKNGRSPDGSRSRPADRAASTGVSPVPASIPNAGDCTHFFPERDVGCKTCEEFFAHQDRLDADPREIERQQHLYRDIELKTLRTAFEQIRSIVRDTIGEELEL
jgi:hypothetical protein